MGHQTTRIKRAYSALTPNERQAKALEESFFEMPDTPLRSELVAHLRPRASRFAAPMPFADLSERGQTWIAERGLDPQEV